MSLLDRAFWLAPMGLRLQKEQDFKTNSPVEVA